MTQSFDCEQVESIFFYRCKQFITYQVWSFSLNLTKKKSFQEIFIHWKKKSSRRVDSKHWNNFLRMAHCSTGTCTLCKKASTKLIQSYICSTINLGNFAHFCTNTLHVCVSADLSDPFFQRPLYKKMYM